MLRVYTQTNLRRDLNLGSPLEIQNFDVNDIVLFTLLPAPRYSSTRVRFTQHVNENAYVFCPFSWRLAGF
jgi:hypothetical protein